MIVLNTSKEAWSVSIDSSHVLIYWEHDQISTAVLLSKEDLKADPDVDFKKSFLDINANNIKIVAYPELLKELKGSLYFKDKTAVKELPLKSQTSILFSPKLKKLQKEKAKLQAVKPIQNSKEPQKSKSKPKKSVYKVLIVDDSSTIRTLLKKILGESENLEVVGAVEHPLEVPEALLRLKPDVVTLDIHMPNMNGVEVLKEYVAPQNIPSVMISSVKMEEGPLVLEALSSGAVDYIEKPALANLANVAPDIIKRVLAAARSDISVLKSSKPRPSFHSEFSEQAINSSLVLIGSSTGGTQALQCLFESLPAEIPPILVVQHIPAVFSKALAERLDSLVPFNVCEAVDGQQVLPGNVYIAPGGLQMKVKSVASMLKLEINDDPPVNRFKPSVDYMFDSVSDKVKHSLVAGILTGMGSDGAKGLLRLRNELGAKTFGQDEASSVVYGMPKAAFELGAVELQCSLDQLSRVLAEKCNSSVLKKAS